MNDFSRCPPAPFIRLSSLSGMIKDDAIVVRPCTSPYSCVSPQTRWPQRTSAGDPAHRSNRRRWPRASRPSHVAPSIVACVALTSPQPSLHPSQLHCTTHCRLVVACSALCIPAHHNQPPRARSFYWHPAPQQNRRRKSAAASPSPPPRLPSQLRRPAPAMWGQARGPGARAGRARRMRYARPPATATPRCPWLPRRTRGRGSGCR
jgi:hypothetical protein